MRAIVLGASVKALACACELAIRGVDVSLAKSLKQQQAMSGRKIRGFSFDTCETMITRPEALIGLFSRAKREIADYLSIIPLDPFARVWFEDGVVINVRRDAGLFALQLDQQFPHDRQGANYCEVVLASRAKNKIGMREAKALITERHVATLCDSLYFQPDSWGAAAIDSGMWYTFGGIRQVGFALERLSSELGVRHCAGKHVSRDTIGNSQVAASVDGNVMKADLVIDCDGEWYVKYFSLFLGINRRYEHLTPYNIFLAHDGQEMRVTAPCGIDPSHAPVRGDVLRIDYPWLKKSSESASMESVALDYLKSFGMPDLDKRTVVKQFGEMKDERDAGLAAMQGVAEATRALRSLVMGPIDARPEAVTSGV